MLTLDPDRMLSVEPRSSGSRCSLYEVPWPLQQCAGAGSQISHPRFRHLGLAAAARQSGLIGAHHCQVRALFGALPLHLLGRPHPRQGISWWRPHTIGQQPALTGHQPLFHTRHCRKSVDRSPLHLASGCPSLIILIKITKVRVRILHHAASIRQLRPELESMIVDQQTDLCCCLYIF